MSKMIRFVEDPREVETAYAHQYEMVSRKFAKLIPPSKSRLVEIGCGIGQLTIPLAKLLPSRRFEVVDTFTGAYSGTLRRLNEALLRAGLKNRVIVHVADYLDWLWNESSDSYSGVISSEFLPEIDSYQLPMLLEESYRLLRHRGTTIHSFLSPSPRNPRQRLLLEADTNPKWRRTPPKEWFSPKPSLVVSKLIRAGFRNVRVKKFNSNLVIRADAAKKLLQKWDVKSSFWKTHSARLVKDGLEVPDWIIISATKP